MVSRAFIIGVKLADIPAWKIAQEAGLNPSVLSKIMSGALVVRPGDKRVLRVANILGLNAEECFEKLNRKRG